LSFANFAMTTAHEVNAARERNQYRGKAATVNFETFEKTSIYSNIDLTFFL